MKFRGCFSIFRVKKRKSKESDQNSIDVAVLEAALKKLDAVALIDILGRRSQEQISKISELFKKKTDKELSAALGEALQDKGDFCTLAKSLVSPAIEFDVTSLHTALEESLPNENIIIEILIGRSNDEIIRLKEEYQKIYARSILQDVSVKTKGHFRSLLEELLKAERIEIADLDMASINEDVVALYKSGEGRIGSDWKKFVEILSKRSELHLREVFTGYLVNDKKKDLVEAIKSEFSGDFQHALVALVQSVNDKPTYVSDLFDKATREWGQENELLIRLIVRYRELDLIKKSFKA
ncbi:Annexin A13, partial [Nowakowskiella sp. JEL0078]